MAAARVRTTAARARLSYGGHTVEFSCAHPRRHAGEGARERAAELQRERVQTKVICRRRWHAAVLVCLASSEKASPCRSGHRAASASLYRPGAKPKKRSKSKKQAAASRSRSSASTRPAARVTLAQGPLVRNHTAPQQHCRLGLARFCPAAGAPLPRGHAHEHRMPGTDAGTAAAPRTLRRPLLEPPQLERSS